MAPIAQIAPVSPRIPWDRWRMRPALRRAAQARWMVYKGKAEPINGWFRGTPILGNLHIWSRPAAGNPPDGIPPYICIYVYMYIFIYVYMYISIYVCTHEKHICVYIYLDTYVSPPAYIHTYVRTYISLHYITLHHITLHYIALHYITLHTYMPIPTNLRRYIHTTPNPPHRGGRGSRGTLHDSWIPGR